MTELKKAYCFRCGKIRTQRVLPKYYSTTPKYKCLHCGRINSDVVFARTVAAGWK